MSLDKKTVPKYLSIIVDDKEKYISSLREIAKKEGISGGDGTGKIKALFIDEKYHSLKNDEYYFEADNILNDSPIIHISFKATGENGETYVNMEIPLSDDVLIDILGYANKRLNKLKNVLESLK